MAIGVAVAGTGFMGWVHLEALRRAGVEVVGILGSSGEKSSRMAADHRIPKAYKTFGEILEDDDVQSVHIGTPNRLHFEMAKATLLANKHVMCEKPLAMTSKESSELVALAKARTHLAAGVNYNIRFYPLCVEARQRIHQGEIGELFHVFGSYVQDWLLKETDYNWRVLSEEGGELRAVSDIGTHWLDLVQSITGLKVDSVFADLKTVHPTRYRPKGEIETFQNKEDADVEREAISISTEDVGNILIRFQGGTQGNLHVSQVTAGRKNCLRFEIGGSAQSIAWNSEEPNTLWLGHRDRSNETLIRDPALLGQEAGAIASYPGGHNEGYADSFKHCFRTFYRYIEAGSFQNPRPFPTFEDGHREIVLCDAILESHRTNRWIDIPGEL